MIMPLTDSRPPKRGKPSAVQMLYDPEAEKAVLGCVMAQPLEVLPDVERALLPKDFFVHAHREIYCACLDLYQRNEAIDTITLHAYLTDNKKADAVGSPGILAELLVGFATHLNVGSYIRRVKEKSLLLGLHEAAMTVLNDIREMPDCVAAVLDRANTAIADATALTNLFHEVKFAEVMERTSREAVEFSEMGGGLPGHSTGFPKLDAAIGGWGPGQLVVIGGASGVGKSALALTFQRHLAKNEIPSGLWTGEMGEDECGKRVLSAESHIPARCIDWGELSGEQQQTIRATSAKIADWLFYIDCQPGRTIQSLRSLARRWKNKYGIEVLFLDHAQLVRSPGFETDKTGEVTSVTRNAKELAKELGITVILNSQLNCDPDEEPNRGNLKNSKSLMEDADKILLLYQESEDGNGDFKKQVIKLDKQRDGASRRKIPVDYLAWRSHYQEPRN